MPDEDGPGAPPPGLYLVGTPIGNLEDITLRALRILAAADVLVCEDTRVTRKLFQRHGLPAPKRLLVANDHTEERAAAAAMRFINGGSVVAVCTDAGMPGISDPGYVLVRQARAAGVPVEVIPGPSAVATAVALTGLASSFTFLGFPPRRDGRLRTLLLTHGSLSPAMVLYESPRRLGRLLAMAAEVCGPERQAAVCLELTKKFERVISGPLGELAGGFAQPPRGEATVVIAGGDKRARQADGVENDTDEGDGPEMDR